MNSAGPILYVGEEPVGRYGQKLKPLLAELMQRKFARKKKRTSFLRIKKSGCWEWMRCKSRGLYGCLTHNKRWYKAHRFFFQRLVGPIPTGLTIDHLCANILCCNPEHLEPVTQGENRIRAAKRHRAG